MYWKTKEEALGRTVSRTGFGRVYGPVVRQTINRMNIVSYIMTETMKDLSNKPKF